MRTYHKQYIIIYILVLFLYALITIGLASYPRPHPAFRLYCKRWKAWGGEGGNEDDHLKQGGYMDPRNWMSSPHDIMEAVNLRVPTQDIVDWL